MNVGTLVLPKLVVSRGALLNWLKTEAPSYDRLIVGLPIDLQGQIGLAAKSVIEYVDSLGLGSSTPIRYVDERLTTALATRRLVDAGKTSRESRRIIDAQAAAEILELALAADSADPGRKLDEF